MQITLVPLTFWNPRLDRLKQIFPGLAFTLNIPNSIPLATIVSLLGNGKSSGPFPRILSPTFDHPVTISALSYSLLIPYTLIHFKVLEGKEFRYSLLCTFGFFNKKLWHTKYGTTPPSFSQSKCKAHNYVWPSLLLLSPQTRYMYRYLYE